jgi:hypothetical protein
MDGRTTSPSNPIKRRRRKRNASGLGKGIKSADQKTGAE